MRCGLIKWCDVKLFRDGEKGSAICSDCSKIVSTTFKRRDVPFIDGKGIAEGILVGVCDECGQVVSIPAQSTPAIAESRSRALKSVEVRLPAIYLDVLDLAAFSIERSASSEFRKGMLCYYLHDLAQDPRGIQRVRSAYQKSLRDYLCTNDGMPKKRFSMKVSEKLKLEILQLEEASELTTTELLKSVVISIQHDVLEKPRKNRIKALQYLAIASG